MSMENGQDEPPEEVIDEEGSVDQAIKKRIIQARERVDETEIALYRDAALEPDITLSDAQRIHIFATTVKQFLRRIEPILRAERINGNEYYYNEVDIGTMTLVPPDTEGYQFSLVLQDHDAKTLRRMLNLPRGVDLPQPHRITVRGLREVIERDPIVTHQWEVCVSKNGAAPNWEYVYPTVQRPLEKSIYEDAVRKADLFLQESGIGVDTDTSGTEIIREFDMSGEQPNARYTVGDYESNPDL